MEHRGHRGNTEERQWLATLPGRIPEARPVLKGLFLCAASVPSVLKQRPLTLRRD